MTVGETLTAPSLGSASGPTGSSKEANDTRGKNPTGGGGAGPNEVHAVQMVGPHSMTMVNSKIGGELVTSLHLIKDIRRLEKYQRDFFLKVLFTFVVLKISSMLMQFFCRSKSP